ncbi:hypothetical protein [Gottfriedia solisilvae]|nr:hypothetical protein [Gottfriedia solisilvae]
MTKHLLVITSFTVGLGKKKNIVDINCSQNTIYFFVEYDNEVEWNDPWE